MTGLDRVTARAGDTVDALIWRERGIGPDALVAVLAVNPGLAARGPELPAGTIVRLPVTPATSGPPVLDLVQLWS